MPRPRYTRSMAWWLACGLFAGAALLAAGGAAAEESRVVKGFATREESQAEFDRVVAPFAARYCNGCHGAEMQEGELDLRMLSPDMKTSTSASRWAVVLDKITLGEMPPEDEARPDEAALRQVVGWIQREMKRANKRIAHRPPPANGNRVPHELLFGAAAATPALDVAPRIRRPSPEIYGTFTGELGKGVNGLGQPFSPEGATTFKDMGAPRIDEPITQQLLRNALAIVEKQTAHTVEPDGALKKIGFTPGEYLRLFDDKQPATDEEIAKALRMQFDRILRRAPSAEETERFAELYRRTVQDAGRAAGARTMLAAVFLLPEAVFRWEVGAGEADEQGRVRLAPREIAFALAYALTDKRPEGWLLAEAEQGKLDTRAGVEAAVRRMLDDPKLDKPRILRFFREYFGYAAATEVFKNDKDNPEHDPRALVEDTERLIQSILEEDRNVLYELLTTNKSYVAYRTAAETKKRRAEELAKFAANKQKEPEKFANKKPPKVGRSIYEAYNLDDFPDEQPVELPRDQRAGVLTQPAWLVAMSKSEENDAIRRGKWIRERLLGGVVPDLPITVDAQLPEAPDQTLRARMAVTEVQYCWKCHTHMNNVGLPLEIYDHFGRFRRAEPVLDIAATAQNVDAKGKPLGPVQREVPVNAAGRIEHVADPQLAGEVRDGLELLRKLAASEYVEQVFVRHAFRYWMGRNESLGDAAALRAAHAAYRHSDGSMRELIVALLTSEPFLYRVPADAAEPPQGADLPAASSRNETAPVSATVPE